MISLYIHSCLTNVHMLLCFVVLGKIVFEFIVFIILLPVLCFYSYLRSYKNVHNANLLTTNWICIWWKKLERFQYLSHLFPLIHNNYTNPHNNWPTRPTVKKKEHIIEPIICNNLITPFSLTLLKLADSHIRTSMRFATNLPLQLPVYTLRKVAWRMRTTGLLLLISSHLHFFFSQKFCSCSISSIAKV